MFIKLALCWWMLLPVTAEDGVTNTFVPLEDAVEIILALQKHFHFRCILLIALQTEMEELTLLAQVMKMLSGHGAWIGATEAQAYNYSLEVFGCAINRPLNIIFYGKTSKPQDLRQVSEWSGPVWIMFVNNTSATDEILSEVFLPLGAEFLIALPVNSTDAHVQFHEAYRILPSSDLHWNIYGNWSREEGLKITPCSFYQRRHNLQGILLDGVTTNNPPFTSVTDPGPLVKIHGFVGNVWNVLENSMNFSNTMDTIIVKRSSNITSDHVDRATSRHAGSPTNIYRSSVFMERSGNVVDGRWTTMVDVVSRREIHFGIDVFSVTSDRAHKVDFTIPLMSERYGIFIRRPDNMEIHWRKYVIPYSCATWTAVGVVLLLVAIALSTARRLERNSAAFTAPNSLFLVYGLFCQQGSDELPQSLAGRISYYTACVLSVLLLSSYSATLISFVTVQTTTLPFRDLEGIMQSRTYQFGIVDKTAEYDFYKNSENPFLRELWDKKMAVDDANFPQSKMEGLQRVCDMRYAFYQQVDVLRHLRPNLTCHVTMLPDERDTVPFAFILSKGSPYRSFFNHRILLMREAGILNKFLHESFVKWETHSKEEFLSVNLMDVSPILVMLASATALSVMILLAEILLSKKLALHSGSDQTRNEASRKFSNRKRFAKYRGNLMLFHFLAHIKTRRDVALVESRSWPDIRNS